MNTDITTYEKQVNPITNQAFGLSIANSEEMVQATVLLSNLNRELDKITGEKEKVTKPLNEALKAERERWKPLESALENAISSIRSKMSSYQTESARKAKEEEEKIASRIGEGKGHIKIETAIKKIDAIERADKQVATEAGLIKFRTDKVLKITDESLIPREYLIANEKSLLTALKKGVIIPGACIEEIQTPLNFR